MLVRRFVAIAMLLTVPLGASLASAQASSPPVDPQSEGGGTSTQPGPVASGVKPKHIGGGVLPPQLIYSTPPEFSEEARKEHKGGTVLINLWVDENGNPLHVHVLRGVGYNLDENAVAAVKTYRFKPATQNGKPVLVELNVEVNFKIVDKAPEIRGP
jgi:periplasmic protein TonB